MERGHHGGTWEFLLEGLILCPNKRYVLLQCQVKFAIPYIESRVQHKINQLSIIYSDCFYLITFVLQNKNGNSRQDTNTILLAVENNNSHRYLFHIKIMVCLSSKVYLSFRKSQLNERFTSESKFYGLSFLITQHATTNLSTCWFCKQQKNHILLWFETCDLDKNSENFVVHLSYFVHIR